MVCDRCVLDHVEFQIDPSSRESGPRMAWVITQRDREARIRALARAWPRDKVTWWKSRRHYGAVSNRKSARVKISTQAPPPKSLEVEPASQDDVWSQ